ncbi:MAG: TonB-dependent receptor [Bacteroidales bacterium]|nr:TonB-dependent receptor [Bacteroidales bacterium]
MKKLYLILVLLSFLFQANFAQVTIKGTVIDNTTGKTLPFASVFFPELNKGTLTDAQGEFNIANLPHGKTTIQFSFVGYKTEIKTIYLANDDIELNIELELAVMQAEQVVISGGSYSSQHQNAIKIELVNSNDISLAGTPTFLEAVSSVPGVDIIAKGAGVAKPVIRGLSMTNILMLNNGIKMENFQFSENHPFLVDEFGADRVEIIKGPASLLYGSDAVGGVINILREKPAPVGKIIGDYTLQLHSNTLGAVSSFGLKGSNDKFFWGFRAGIKSHEDYKDGNNDFIPNTRFNEKSFKANIGINKNFGLFRFYYDFNKPEFGMAVPAVISLIDMNSRNNEFWYQDLTSHIISTKNTLFLGSYKIKLNAAYQINNRRLQTDNFTPAFEMVNMNLNTFSYDFQVMLPSNINSEYIVGFQGANKVVKNNGAPSDLIPDATVNDFSGYILVQHSFFDKLKTQAGVRYDIRFVNTIAELNSRVIDTMYNNFSGSVGATYQLSDKILLRSNVASAYRTPNLAELTQDGVHGVRYEQGNINLHSQRNYEADFSSHFHTKHIMLDFSIFYNRIFNYIYLAPTDELSANGSQIFRYSQTNSTLYGGEVSADFLPFNWLDFKTSYSYLIGIKDDNTYLPFIPHNKLKFETKLQKSELLFFQNVFFKVGGVYAQSQQKPALFETETDAYFLLNASIGAEYKVANQNILFSLNANNLLNELYYDHLSTLKNLGFYNMGRNISFTVKIPFALR